MSSTNILSNPSFDDGLTGWLVSEDVPNGVTCTAQDGEARLVKPSGAALNPAIFQSGKMAPGAPYKVTVAITSVTGTLRVRDTVGPLMNYTTAGVKKFSFTAAGFNLNLSIVSPSGTATIAYVILQREDQSMSSVIVTMRDFDGDKKQTSAMLGPVTDGASYVTREAEAAALRDAINAVAGNVARYQFQAQDTSPNDQNAATLVFQTHIRWIVQWVDSVTGDGPYEFDIPTADIGNNDLVLAGSTEHDPAAAEWIALKAAFNGKVINPRTGSTVNITRIFLEE